MDRLMNISLMTRRDVYRRTIRDAATEALAAAHSSHIPAVALMLDVDRFKKINSMATISAMQCWPGSARYSTPSPRSVASWWEGMEAKNSRPCWLAFLREHPKLRASASQELNTFGPHQFRTRNGLIETQQTQSNRTENADRTDRSSRS